MPRGSKSSYSGKQRRMAAHIEDSVRKRGGSEEDAERIGWATVNKETGGARGKKKSGGSSMRKSSSSRKASSSSKSASRSRSDAAKKGWETRRKNATKKRSSR